MSQAILSTHQRRALSAASRRAIYSEGAVNAPADPGARFPGVTIRSLVRKDYLTPDERGGYIITPGGRQALAVAGQGRAR